MFLSSIPTSQFTYKPKDPTFNDTLTFNDHSKDIDGTIQSWTWDFGDGTTSNESSPTHTYTTEATYTVTLTVIDDDGDASVMSKNIVVLPVNPPSDDIGGSLIIYIVYLIFFIAMITMVIILKRKFESKK